MNPFFFSKNIVRGRGLCERVKGRGMHEGVMAVSRGVAVSGGRDLCQWLRPALDGRGPYVGMGSYQRAWLRFEGRELNLERVAFV